MFANPSETLIPGEREKGEAFHPGIGYASYLVVITGMPDLC